jgi:hypothetical protein
MPSLHLKRDTKNSRKIIIRRLLTGKIRDSAITAKRDSNRGERKGYSPIPKEESSRRSHH